MSRELAVVFDLVKRHVPIVSFGDVGESPAYDLYSALPRTAHGDAMALLVEHGLAHAETWGNRTFYRLDSEALAKLQVK